MPKMHINKSIEINAPADKIFHVLNNFNQWQPWSPWLLMEPEAKVTVADDNKSYSWEGKRTGSGNMKILNEDQGKSIDYDLQFLKPWKSTAAVKFELESKGDSTRVSWLMDSSLPFFLFWMKKMMEAFVGMDYDRGLSMLKEYVEDGEVHSRIEFKGTSAYDGCSYVGIRTTTNIDEIGGTMEQDFTRLGGFLDSHKDEVDGPAFSIYHKWDPVKGKVTYTCGVPVKKTLDQLPEGIQMGEIPPTLIYTIAHTGPYAHLGNAWTTLYTMQRNKEFKTNKGIDPFEVYVNVPGEVPEKELITAVNFPVK